MRRWLPLAFAFALSGCGHAAPEYKSFADLPYGYERSRDLWCPKAQLFMHVEELGARHSAKPPIVLLHPWGLNMTVWAQVAPELAKERRVILIDLPGHGKSGKLHTHYPMPRLAQAVLDVMDALAVPTAVVAGNSLGGATSIAVAERAPQRVQALVLIAAPGGAMLPQPVLKAAHSLANRAALRTLSDEAWFFGVAFVARSLGPAADRLSSDLMGLRHSPEWPAWSDATITILRSVATYAPELERLHMPALVVHGTGDLLITEGLNTALAERLPQGRLQVLDGCGHMPEVECPEALMRVVRAFLQGQGGTPGPS